MHQRQFRRLEYVIDKIIPFLSVCALMAFVVEFDSKDWLQGFWVTQKKVNVLAVNFICVGAILSIITSLGVKQVTEFDFGKDVSRIPYDRFEIEEEIKFSRRDKFIYQMIWIFDLGRFLVFLEKQIGNKVDNFINCFVR